MKRMRNGMIRIYDGREFCNNGCGHCPVIDIDPKTRMATIHDPARPESGRFTMTEEELSNLIRKTRLTTRKKKSVRL